MVAMVEKKVKEVEVIKSVEKTGKIVLQKVDQ